MKTYVYALAAVFSLLPAVQRPAVTAAAPCTSATAACTEWVTLRGGPGRAMVYRNHGLEVPNARITRALVMVHGTGRNADHYFLTAVSAAFLAGALDDTVVIAPHMIDRTDHAEPNEIAWQTSWRTGGPAISDASLSSFDFVDEILRKLARKSVFPNLKHVVVTGHSAGGQFANRYAMSSKVHDILGIPVSYVVANPSSYAWPDAVRPLPQDDADPAAAKDGWNYMPNANPLPPHTKFTFGPLDATKAPSYNQWPAGFENRTGYTDQLTNEQLKKQLIERPTTFLLGQVDTLPLGGFDSSPNAMSQGPTRRARGEAYVKYLNEVLGAKHAIFIVSECGHNDRCMYTTGKVLPYLFPGVTEVK